MSLSVVIMGLSIGFLVGLTGVGAASLLTPFLVFMGIHPSVAVGTDLVYNSVTKLFGVVQHWRQRTVNTRLVRYLATGSLPSAVAAIVLLHLLNAHRYNQDIVIKHALGVILIVVAASTLLRVGFDRRIRPNRWQLRSLEEKRGLTIGIGIVFGFVVGLTSIGSGSLFAIALLYLFSLSGAELVGTDIAHALLLATVAGALNAGYGTVNWILAGNLLIGSIPGVLLGSTLSAKVPSRPLRALLSVLILIGGIKMV